MSDFAWSKGNTNDLFILVKVKPNAKKTQVTGIIEINSIYPVKKAISVSIKSVPEDNKANLELIEFFSEKLGTGRNNISIAAGQKNRIKVLKIPSSLNPEFLL
jgi:uncharacterized protein (TIGR00251 family)